MLIRRTGKTKFMWFPMTTGVTAVKGTLMALSSGALIIATATTPSYYCIGVLRRTITSASPEYTTQDLVEVEVPVDKNTEWTADIYGTLVVADVGLYCDIIAGTSSTSTTVNRGGSTYDIAFVTKFISTSKAAVILNIGADGHAKA